MDRPIQLPPDLVRHRKVFPQNEKWHITEKLKAVHEKGITGKGAIVANHDTGVFTDHPYFNGEIELFRDYTGHGKHDRNGHGTHTAGITKQVAPGCEIRVYKVLGDNGFGGAGLDRAILDCADDGCHFANCSYGSSQPSNDDEINGRAYEKGLLLRVCSAGNSGFNGGNTIGWPARSETSWCNGAYRVDGSIAGFSSGGRQMDSAAPGERIYSASHRGGEVFMSGTSMSCPHEVGHFCLLWQGRRWAGLPDLVGPDEWKNWMKSEGFFIDEGSPGFDPRFGEGIFDMEKAIDWLLDLEPVL